MKISMLELKSLSSEGCLIAFGDDLENRIQIFLNAGCSDYEILDLILVCADGGLLKRKLSIDS